MKKIFLIYGHYNDKSFNAAIRDTFIKTAKEKGHVVDTVDLYAQKLLGRRGSGWRMGGIDSDGADLERDGRFARLPFPSVISNASEAREILVSLAAEARCK